MLAEPRKLGAKARTALERVQAGRDEAFIPAVAVAEILLLRGLGRTDIGLAELKEALEQTPNLRFLPLDLAQLEEFAALASIRDPYDRLIASATRSLRAALLTRDGALTESGVVETIWS